MTAPIRSLYVHVPFCHTICGYCDFYSVVLDKNAAGPLVDALLRELDTYRDRIDTPLDTLFVGGGTPTTLPPATLARLLAPLAELLGDGNPEFTVEANPATVTSEIARALADAGVNRVSIGAQSFDPSELRVLERIHEPDQVAQTVTACRAAGIPQVNLDLIFAIPGQSRDAWMNNLDRALALEPDHLSCYALTYEPGTPLYERLQAGRVRRVDTDIEADMYEQTIDRLEAAGFARYEISNFARPGCACRHNLAYWRNEPYVGIGPSAAGYVGGLRYKNVPDAAAYVAAVSAGRSARNEQETRSPEQSARESMMLGLRLCEGIDRAAFAERFGRDPTELFAEQIGRYAELNLLAIDERRVRLTRKGMLVADTVMADFL